MKIWNGILASALVLSSNLVFANDGAPRKRFQLNVVDSSYVFPSSANVQGIGAFFKTRMVLFNPTPSPMTINMLLSTPGGPVGPQSVDLASLETRIYEDFLSEAFGYTGGAGIRLSESSNSRPFVASAEVYADSVNGRFSTAIFGMLVGDRVESVSESGHSLSVGLRVDAANRANYGCANADNSPVSVQADFFTSAGGPTTPARSVVLDLPANGWQQQPVPVSDDQINIRFRTFGGIGPLGAYCYGVNVNNTSADGTSVPAVFVPPSQ